MQGATPITAPASQLWVPPPPQTPRPQDAALPKSAKDDAALFRDVLGLEQVELGGQKLFVPRSATTASGPLEFVTFEPDAEGTAEATPTTPRVTPTVRHAGAAAMQARPSPGAPVQLLTTGTGNTQPPSPYPSWGAETK